MPHRWAVVGATLVLVTACAVGLLVAASGSPECVVRVGDRAVELTTREAEAVTTGGEVTDEAVAAAVSGESAASLSCRHGGSTREESDRLDDRGLTARAAAVRADVRARFGALPLGGFAPGGVTTGHMPGSAHYEGRAIDAFLRPVTARNRTRGWALAHYLVAHAERLAIDTVIFDRRIWTARRSDEGWRDYRVDTSGRSRATARILEHRDHVHVDVAD